MSHCETMGIRIDYIAGFRDRGIYITHQYAIPSIVTKTSVRKKHVFNRLVFSCGSVSVHATAFRRRIFAKSAWCRKKVARGHGFTSGFMSHRSCKSVFL